MREKIFVCKFCNKRFPCGKSLGGHIRAHTNEYSTQETNGAEGNADLVKVTSFDGGRKRKRDSAPSKADAALNSAYGLMENPKTMRFVDSSRAIAFEANLCKECGKGFASLKALFGHMACHSGKERGANKFKDNYGVRGKDKFVMDNQSDTETSTPTHPRRSKRMMRFKTLNPQPSPSSLTDVELEQEEGAKLLLLLSKDSGHRDQLNYIADSSENNSVPLVAKFPSVDKMTGRHMKKKQQHDGKLKLKSAEVAMSDDSNSEYFLSGYRRNDDLKNPEVESSRFEHLGSDLGKGTSRIDGRKF